jgi:hypothetical protein
MTKGNATLLIGLAMLASCLAGCHGDEQDSVLLRYSPKVGEPYAYSADLMGYAQVAGEMTVISYENGWYHVEFSGALFGEPYDVSMDISDRHNSNHPGYLSLNFPDEPVAVGDTWEGQVPWYFEHYFVLDETPITVPASYRLLEINEGREGTYAVIEQTVDEDLVVEDLVFHLGQLGMRWDDEGRITQVDQGYDAFGKLLVGDVVVRINGQDATTEQERNSLAEEYVQHPKEDSLVSLAILRDGSELTVDVQKSIDELALVRAENLKSVVLARFDVDRGILLSAEVSTSEEIVFTSLTGDAFPIVDSYGSFSKFGYLEGRTAYEESYGGSGVAWTLTLQE